ncbi:21534_t:CDS:1, partial [Gigaspora margarita]
KMHVNENDISVEMSDIESLDMSEASLQLSILSTLFTSSTPSTPSRTSNRPLF